MVALTTGGVLVLGLLVAAAAVLHRRRRTDLSLSPVRVSRPPSTPKEERGPWASPRGCGFP